MHNGITYVWARISRTKEEAAESGPKEHPSSKLESFTIELEVNAFCYGAWLLLSTQAECFVFGEIRGLEAMDLIN